MEQVKNIFLPKPDPRQQVRGCQLKIRQQCNKMKREIQAIQHLEKKTQTTIRGYAKGNDMVSAKVLAKEIIRSRKTICQLNENIAQLNSISLRLGESLATYHTADHLSQSYKVIELVNDLLKAPKVAATMKDFSREMIKADVISEMVNEAMDNALDTEEMEDQTEQEIDQVLIALAGETTARLPEAFAPKNRHKQDEANMVASGDEQKELDEIRARLDRVRS